jgi:hypothetical protein
LNRRAAASARAANSSTGNVHGDSGSGTIADRTAPPGPSSRPASISSFERVTAAGYSTKAPRRNRC